MKNIIFLFALFLLGLPSIPPAFAHEDHHSHPPCTSHDPCHSHGSGHRHDHHHHDTQHSHDTHSHSHEPAPIHSPTTQSKAASQEQSNDELLTFDWISLSVEDVDSEELPINSGVALSISLYERGTRSILRYYRFEEDAELVQGGAIIVAKGWEGRLGYMYIGSGLGYYEHEDLVFIERKNKHFGLILEVGYGVQVLKNVAVGLRLTGNYNSHSYDGGAIDVAFKFK